MLRPIGAGLLKRIAGLVDFVKIEIGVSRCPLCNCKEVDWVSENFDIVLKGGPIVIPMLRFQRCRLCHEAFLDHTAMKRIDAALDTPIAKARAV
jgi:hypothetical protein